MHKNSTHVVRSTSGGWAVRKAGSRRAVKTFKTQAEAAKLGRIQARKDNTTLYVHRADGTIKSRFSYISK